MKQCSNEAIGALYIVATPIGNMGDITLRAIETLKNVDLVACEDTRVTGALLHKLNIKKPMKPIHQHSLDSSIQAIIDLLLEGKDIAYMTDGGTPGVSDPGQRLIYRIRQQKNQRTEEQKNNSNCHSGLACPPNWRDPESMQMDPRVKPEDDKVRVIPVPGASALTAAVSVSGMVEKEFYFAGFLPKKKGRQTWFRNASLLHCPIVIYESALRLERTLRDIQEHFGGDTEVFIAREMTKMFEEYWSGDIVEIIEDLPSHKLKGEIVLIIRR